jgi:hypothetical protein
MLSLVDLRYKVSGFPWFFGGKSRALCEYDDEASFVEEDEKIRACFSVIRDFDRICDPREKHNTCDEIRSGN